MQLNPYLLFNGQCEAAFKFYEKCLSGKITGIMTFGDSPMSQQMPPEWRSKIIHARLVVGDEVIMGSDAPPDRFEVPKGFSVAIGIKDPAEGERIFNDLSANGKVTMAFQKTFWSPGFGMLVDQYGIPWMVNCEQAV